MPNKVKICSKENQSRQLYHGDFVFEKNHLALQINWAGPKYFLLLPNDDIKSPDDIRCFDGNDGNSNRVSTVNKMC